MQSLLINSFPLLLTLSTAFGVFVHDTHLDQMTATAALPAIVAGYTVADAFAKKADHIHYERPAFSSGLSRLSEGQPRVTPRNGDDKKYVAQKKFSSTTYGTDYKWPSD